MNILQALTTQNNINEQEKRTESSGKEIETALVFEDVMRKASLLVSSISMVGMIGGFVLLAYRLGFSLPDVSVIPLSKLASLSPLTLGLSLMSISIVLLAILPAIRVLLALGFYIKRRAALDILVALIVLCELLYSMLA